MNGLPPPPPQVSDLLRAAAMLGELIRPLRLQMQTSGICKQVIQWLEATTGVRNVYVSVPDAQSCTRGRTDPSDTAGGGAGT